MKKYSPSFKHASKLKQIVVNNKIYVSILVLLVSSFLIRKFRAKIRTIFNPMILKKFQNPLTAYSQELCAVGAANTVGRSDSWKIKNARYSASNTTVVMRREISGITFFFWKNSLQPS